MTDTTSTKEGFASSDEESFELIDDANAEIGSCPNEEAAIPPQLLQSIRQMSLEKGELVEKKDHCAKANDRDEGRLGLIQHFIEENNRHLKTLIKRSDEKVPRDVQLMVLEQKDNEIADLKKTIEECNTKIQLFVKARQSGRATLVLRYNLQLLKDMEEPSDRLDEVNAELVIIKGEKESMEHQIKLHKERLQARDMEIERVNKEMEELKAQNEMLKHANENQRTMAERTGAQRPFPVTIKTDENGEFGFQLDGRIVTHVLAGGSAEKSRIQYGDQIICIDRDVLEWRTIDSIIDLMSCARNRGQATLMVRRFPSRTYVRDEGTDLEHPVNVENDEKNDGELKECVSTAIHKTDMTAVEAEMNKRKTENEENKRIIGNLVNENENMKEIPHKSSAGNFQIVNLRVGDSGKFEFSNRGSLIYKVNAGGPADLSGMKVGDQIITVDGISCNTLSDDEISDMFEKARANGRTTMKLRYNPHI